MIGIYQIEHIGSGKKYIGQSVNIKKRWIEHKWKLNKNVHPNPKLQAAWNKHGESEFLFTVLVYVSHKEELDMIEQIFLDEKPWFNVATCAMSPAKGRVWDRTIVEARRSKLLGKKRTEEQKARISKGKKGKPQTEAHKKALSKVRKGCARPTNRRKIKCIETGEVFEKMTDAANKFGGRLAHLCSHMAGVRKTFKQHTFMFIDVPINWNKRGK